MARPIVYDMGIGLWNVLDIIVTYLLTILNLAPSAYTSIQFFLLPFDFLANKKSFLKGYISNWVFLSHFLIYPLERFFHPCFHPRCMYAYVYQMIYVEWRLLLVYAVSKHRPKILLKKWINNLSCVFEGLEFYFILINENFKIFLMLVRTSYIA